MNLDDVQMWHWSSRVLMDAGEALLGKSRGEALPGDKAVWCRSEGTQDRTAGKDIGQVEYIGEVYKGGQQKRSLEALKIGLCTPIHLIFLLSLISRGST